MSTILNSPFPIACKLKAVLPDFKGRHIKIRRNHNWLQLCAGKLDSIIVITTIHITLFLPFIIVQFNIFPPCQADGSF